MQDIKGKTAFVTGAASGIGLSLCRALANQGVKVMMSDINVEQLNSAAASLREETSGDLDVVVCDVAKLESVKAAAETTRATFGAVHLLFNNAGVGLAGRPGHIDIKDWQWIVDINLMGIVHGVQAFVPDMVAHKQGGHIVNTASMAGHSVMAGMAPYHATKFAAVGYSETLRQELAPVGIGVSVLCPTWVKSNIHNTGAQSPTAMSPNKIKKEPSKTAAKVYQTLKSLVENGMEPDQLADLVLKSINANRLYIFNDPEARAAIDDRRKAILDDYDACLKDLGLV